MLNLNPIYCIGGVLIASGLLLLLAAELVAWKDSYTGNTISEVVWAANIPGFLIAAAALSVSAGILSVSVHFIARGKWGL